MRIERVEQISERVAVHEHCAAVLRLSQQIGDVVRAGCCRGAAIRNIGEKVFESKNNLRLLHDDREIHLDRKYNII